jgi:hypothetical protein
MYKLKNKIQKKRSRPMSHSYTIYMQNNEMEYSLFSRQQTKISDPTVIERIKRMSYVEILS